MVDCSEYFDRNTCATPNNGCFICKRGKLAMLSDFIAPVLFLCLTMALLKLGLQNTLPFPIALGSAVVLVFFIVSGFAMLQMQVTYYKWILYVTPDQVIIKVGESKDNAGYYPVAIGIPITKIEYVRGVIRDRLVKKGRSSTAMEHLNYIELKPITDPTHLISALVLRDEFMGMTIKSKVVTLENGLIRVQWNGVAPSMHSVVKYFTQYTKAEIVEAPTENSSSSFAAPNP
jgi:hypothetical protein